MNNKIFKSPLRWAGGKQKAMKYVAPYFPATFKEFRSPFIGGGSDFFHARSNNLAEQYWINDLYGPLVAFYHAARDPKACAGLRKNLQELLDTNPTLEQRKQLFYTFKEQIRRPHSGMLTALYFYYLNRVSFSGTVEMGGFSSSAAMDRFTQSSIDRLSALPEALKGVRITHGDFQPVIEEDGDGVFCLCDPPYLTVKGLYSETGNVHARLAATLRETKHKFLLTYDDCPEVRSLYSWANIEPLVLQYSMVGKDSHNKRRSGNELIIRNY